MKPSQVKVYKIKISHQSREFNNSWHKLCGGEEFYAVLVCKSARVDRFTVSVFALIDFDEKGQVPSAPNLYRTVRPENATVVGEYMVEVNSSLQSYIWSFNKAESFKDIPASRTRGVRKVKRVP